MKKLISMLVIPALLMVVFITHNVQAGITWSDPVRIDTEIGQYPSLSYAPNGDLRVFYYNETTGMMVVKKRASGDTSFTAETEVYDGGKAIGIHYAGNDTIDLSVTTGPMVYVLQSVDNGDNWSNMRSYAASNNTGSPSYLPSCFTEEDTVLRLTFGYVYHNAVLGDKPQSYHATRIAGSWNKQSLIEDGRMYGIWEYDTNVCVVTNRGVHFSSDNGLTFLLLGNSDPIPDQLKASDMAVDGKNRIYLLHTYSYGTGDNNKQLTFAYSDDDGATWSSPQTPVVSNSTEYFFFPHLALDSSRMVAVWLDDQNSTDFGHKTILYTVSMNSGQSWRVPDTLFSSTGTEIIPNTYSTPGMEIECYNGTASLAYSVKDGTEKHIYLTELLLNDITEIPEYKDLSKNKYEKWIRIFPTAGNGLINIRIDNIRDHEVSLSIISCNGRVILSKRLSPKASCWIDRSKLSRGVYLIKLQEKAVLMVTKMLL